MVWQTKLKFRQRRNVIHERFAAVYFAPREYRTKFSEYNLVSIRGEWGARWTNFCRKLLLVRVFNRVVKFIEAAEFFFFFFHRVSRHWV